MLDEVLEIKKKILFRLVDSGINITPKSLDAIAQLENPQDSLNKILKDLAILPSFKSHITEDILLKTNSTELLKILKRITFYKEKQKLHDVQESQDVDLKKGSRTSRILTTSKTKMTSNLLGESTPQTKFPQKQHAIKEEKRSQILKRNQEKSFESSGSKTHFSPVAREYDHDYKIISDPTGKLYTTGDYEDFYALTLDKFKKLLSLMQKRQDVKSSMNIKNILSLRGTTEVSAIGLVNNIHHTKNGNVIFTLEDLTGEITVLVRKDLDNPEIFKIIERTINDQMLYIEGSYNPANNSKSGIIYANYLTKIDIPANYKPSMASVPLSIALISDTHIGSKEFEEKTFERFINFLNGKIGSSNQRNLAGRIKYLVINGDLVDGIGVYPNQQDDLIIKDIYEQYKYAHELLSRIPDYIKIFYVAGNHEPVRNAIPRPAVPRKYCEDLVALGVKCLGNPSIISTHGVKTLIYHGEGIHDMNLLIHDLDINKPTETMKEFLKCRHLAPIYGEKTQLAPTNKDWLVIEKIPDVFHTAHVHINGYGKYRNVNLINSGCFQDQTDYMRSFGIDPTPGKVPILELDTLKIQEIDFKRII